MRKFHFILKYFLIIAGSIILINGLILSVTTNFNLGNLLQLMLGFSLVGYGIFYKWIKEKIHRFFRISYFGIVLFFTVFSLSLVVYGSFDTITCNEDAVIILGAGLRGNKPGTLLKERLDTATEYYKKNPEVIFVLSGGKGSDEKVSEAEAMAVYLIEKGVYPKNIIIEDKSTSTKENFEFSKIKLDEYFGEKEYSAGYITNEFHIYRAGLYAKRAGLENTTHAHSNSRPGGLISTCMRETLATVKLWILGR